MQDDQTVSVTSSHTSGAMMIHIDSKPETHRRAVARAVLRCRPETARRIGSGSLKKGDAIAAARISGVMAAKRTPDLIPLCHPLPLTAATLSFEVRDAEVVVESIVETVARTGVEMEALTAVTVAALTIYDMAKGIDKGMTIEHVGLWEKHGGQSGHWLRDEDVVSGASVSGEEGV